MAAKINVYLFMIVRCNNKIKQEREGKRSFVDIEEHYFFLRIKY